MNQREAKHLKKRLVTKDREVVIPRWASDMAMVTKIQNKQKLIMDPDAIFGRIDPRQTDMVTLAEIFKETTR